MSATATRIPAFRIPACPGIDRNQPHVRAHFGKRGTVKIDGQNYVGPVCAVLTRQVASVIGGAATETHKAEFQEREVETVPANVGK
jgi:hypothetical protein